MDYTLWNLPTQPLLVNETPSIQSLYETLQGLNDPRRAQGKRYTLALILRLLILAKLAGQQTLSGATEWIRHRSNPLARRFGLSLARCVTLMLILSRCSLWCSLAIVPFFRIGKPWKYR